ncbi:restriction endonuclease subunit S [Treponema sp. OMZ 792]|uniref:restriction endonuclease subunit S n=1 Tax=unclassified Treponema TaxID=2638727 RepID=UPI0020A5F56B|nr:MULTISPECIES: restriction endonuclease subunit S [unclassified Treponema]UTC75310.1 restriction endonuclease subunit S [Treponema sp. OMZ 792]UTC79311.1 restriction endonuclease subunit S [Treponema sp. OMZ 798]
MNKITTLEYICDIITEKIPLNKIINDHLINLNYISTENMLPNKNGIIPSKSIPDIKSTNKYKINDILVSNIRPYFKKIWLATHDGVCSNDVLVFRAKENYYYDFIYYNLANDRFFDYVMKTSKGTKMPRGDKSAINKFDIHDFEYKIQKKLTKILRAIDSKIEINKLINDNLSA